MTTSLESMYTAAMALNNIGISLLQRGADDEAVQAMSFAVVLIRDISKVSSSEPAGLSTTRLDEILKKTNQSLAMCQQSNDSPSTESMRDGFQVITHEDIFRFAKDGLEASPEGNRTISSLIRVELDATSITDMTTYYPGIESSIVLQNLGKAYMKMALEDAAIESALEKRRCACGLFKLSYSILETLYSGPCPQNHDHLLPQFLPLMIINVQSLIFTMSVLGLMSETTTNLSTHLLQLCEQLHSVCYASNNMQDILAKAA